MKKSLIIFIGLLLSGFSLQAQYGYYGIQQGNSGGWSIGLRGGTSLVLGDVDFELPGSYEAGFFVQKRVSSFVDFRLYMSAGENYGLDTRPSSGIRNNAALNGTRSDAFRPYVNYDTVNALVFHNFNMEYYDAQLMIKLNLNRLFFPRAENWDLYVSGGLGTLLYVTYINAVDDRNQLYDYGSIQVSDPFDPVAVRTQLAEMRDGTYETVFDEEFISRPGLGDFHIFATTFTAAAGMRFKLSPQWAIGVEGRYLYTREDMLDGQKWTNDNRPTEDLDALLSLGFTFDYTFGGR
jgi:opacity protein-like surface antigen